MSDDRDLQDWFNRSVEALPAEPFTLAVLQRVQRKERHWQLLRYLAWFAALSSCCLLLSELIPTLDALVTLPSAVVDVGGEQWPVLQVLAVAIGLGWWLFNQVRDPDFTQRAILQVLRR
ncbi:MAG TPA: hypothetical protein VMH83_15875 [Candidatus Acidoferrum sp.]|nr:hypothetical protein [Candidatus Acidoferrum sp.]